MSEYELTDLPNFAAIHSALLVAGDIVKESGMRVSMHPGQFNILCSPDPALIAKTVKELDQHAQIFDCMGLAVDHNYPINIHIGATYGDKEAAADRFCQNFKLLSHSTQSRLVVENDDKSTQYSVRDLYDLIWIRICTPITFDYHHHRFNDGGLSEQDALGLAGDTWYCRQLVHYSSCKKTFEDPGVIARSHADYIYERINDYGHSLDIELEAKAKDLALIRYLANIDTLLENYLPFDDKRVFEKVE
jgi:UV DNA damage endonuclease